MNSLLRGPRDKVPLAVAIGLVSAMGAVFTWHATVLSNGATDADRRALRELAGAREAAAEVETAVDHAQRAYVEATGLLSTAAALESQAGRGEVDRSVATVRAASLRRQAEALAAEGGFDLPDLSAGDEEPALDVEALRDELRAGHPELAAPTVSGEIEAADAARLRSERMAALLVAVVAAVGLLTAAELTSGPPRRRWFAIAGGVIALVSLALGIGSW